MSASNGVAVVAEGTAGAGSIVYWRLAGDVDPVKLAARWADADLDEKLLPHPTSPALALGRAMRALRAPRTLVRPLESRRSRALVGERNVLAEDGSTSLAYAVGLRASLDVVGRLVVDPAGHPSEEALRANYTCALVALSPSDVGGWLVDLVRAWDGVALRDSGGVYYLPPAGSASWAAARQALAAASAHVLHEIPAMRTAAAVAALLDSLSAEVVREAEQLEADLFGAGAPGVRGLRSRVTHCVSVEKKVARYEALLETHVEALGERLGKLRGTLSAAIPTAEAAKDGAA